MHYLNGFSGCDRSLGEAGVDFDEFGWFRGGDGEDELLSNDGEEATQTIRECQWNGLERVYVVIHSISRLE